MKSSPPPHPSFPEQKRCLRREICRCHRLIPHRSISNSSNAPPIALRCPPPGTLNATPRLLVPLAVMWSQGKGVVCDDARRDNVPRLRGEALEAGTSCSRNWASVIELERTLPNFEIRLRRRNVSACGSADPPRRPRPPPPPPRRRPLMTPPATTTTFSRQTVTAFRSSPAAITPTTTTTVVIVNSLPNAT
jgi:hypothetical protein